LDAYAERNIFRPLTMTHTRFRPPVEAADDIAPTAASTSPAGIVVNDPMAARMGGVAGHAGLFSTADDLARFASMLVGRGSLDGVSILRPESVAAMTAIQGGGDRRLRGLGWDLGPADPSARANRFPPGSYGHTGYTGTMLWIDPASGTYVIVLTNRTYDGVRGDAQPLRDAVLSVAFTPAS
jgi:CubicO group peptidase (beta-lactamase class C family)